MIQTTSPEGSILTSHGWVTGKVEFAGHAISGIDGRTLSAGAKPRGPYVLPGFIDLHVHGGGGGDWRGGEEGVRTFVRYHTSYGTTLIAPTTAIGPIAVIEQSLSAITSIAATRQPGEAVVLGAHLEGPFLNPLKPGAMEVEQAAEMTSARQAEYLGLQDVGRIEPGARACLVKLDEDLRLQGVWVDGESIAPA